MSWPLIIITILGGLVLVALEIVALPGAVCGIVGGAMVALAVWQTYANYGSTAGIITLLVSIAVGILLLVILMKSRTWKRFSLNEESDSRVNQIDATAVLPGAEGRTISRLAPAGKARIGGQIVEVHSNGEFIEPETQVVVTEIEGYRIVVRRKDDEATQAAKQTNS